MTIKHLTGAYPDGYSLSAAYTGLVIESTASVGGSGVIAFSKATITNLGQVRGSDYAVQIASRAGGAVTNGSASDTAALIEGDRSGVYVRGAVGAVTNFGTISGAARYGVRIGGDGAVVNGSAADRAALMTGGYSGVYVVGAASVTNFGTMSGAVRYGIRLGDGGMVTNGSNADTQAMIEGGTGGIHVNGQSVTIANFGTISATSRWGIVMDGGGLVTNGSAADTTALIEGGSAGVDNRASGATVTIDNFGTIKGGGSYAGVFSEAGVTVTNGSARDVTARIEGYTGVECDFGLARITNFGTILGSENQQNLSSGVFMHGGTVTNGSATDVTALIEGYAGIYNRSRPARISNFGTIETNQGHGVGIFLNEGGIVRNGSAADTSALIQGASGGLFARDGASLRIANFGTIRSVGAASAYGVELRQHAKLTNGSAGDAGALISGKAGVIAPGGGVTITNFGTIAGTGGTAVRLVAGDKLRVEAGAVFEGAVLGGGGELALASGKGTIDALAGGEVTVSGRGRTTTYSDFGTLRLAKGSRFTLTGSGAIAGGGTATLIDNGRLTVTGALVVSGTLSGRGNIVLAGGATVEIDSAAPASLSTTFKGGSTGTLALGTPAGFAATIAGFAAGETIDLLDTAATTAVLNGSDQLVITNGATAVATLQLRGDYAGDSFDLASDGHGGTAITLTPGPPVAPTARLVSAMASMTAGAGAAVAPAWKPEDAARPLFASPRAAFA